MSGPRVVIGVPVYRGGAHLREAIESLLAQDFRDVRLVVTDDLGDPDSVDVIREYQRWDDRIEYSRNARRLGMIENWRAAFDLGRERYPHAEYFAWGSDHDVWHPCWLSFLVAELDRDPARVLAYPRTHGIDEQSRPLLPGRKVGFETVGIASPTRRLAATVDGIAAGNMIYGLFRADALAACGVFPAVLLPDRLVLAKLSIRGQFREVPRTLWYRRFFAGVRPSLPRQRASFFPDGVPLYARLPWWLVHGGAMAIALVVRGEGRPTVGRARGGIFAALYLLLTLRFQLRQRRRRVLRFWNRNRKRLRLQRRRLLARSAKQVRKGLRRVRKRRDRFVRVPALTRRGRLG